MRLPAWLRRARRDAELEEEIGTHLEMAIRDRMARGESREEAEFAARREFGNVELVREVTRDMWGDVWLDHRLQDLRYAVRGLVRSPGLTAAVVLTLGLGLGANAAVFGLVDRLFLRVPSGIPHAEQVRRLYQTVRGQVGPIVVPLFSYPVYRVMADAVEGAARLTTYRQARSALGRGDDAPKASVVWAGPAYFDVLGIRPAHGRLFSPEELAMGSGARVAVISDTFWRKRLGGDPSVLGSRLELDGISYAIVGVAPRDFHGIDVDAADVWVPLAALPWPADIQGEGDRRVPFYKPRDTYALDVIARVPDEADRARVGAVATSALRSAESALQRADSLVTVATGSIILARGPGREADGAPIATRLAGVALIVLLIACANVANLLLARAMRRRREIAVRLALGV